MTAVDIADADFVFQQAAGRQVLAKCAEVEIIAREFSRPVLVMLIGISVDRAVGSAMRFHVGLAIARQMHLAQPQPAPDGTLVNARVVTPPVDLHRQRLRHIQRQQLHASSPPSRLRRC